MTAELRFDGRVAIITGAGGGLGRAYAILLASRGCAVVVNDLGGSREGMGASQTAADKVVSEIRQAGGKAIANYDSVENGENIVAAALANFGKVDILINNAGVLRDKSFAKMTDQDWDLVHRVHLYGAYKVTKAAWEHFKHQNYGRIIMTASAAGIFGNHGQSNYGSAKMALYGLGRTLAREGSKNNIYCNVVAPIAGSRITETVLPPDLLEALKPEYVAPFIGYLCHDSCRENGGLYEIGAGYGAKLRWERSEGALLKVDDATFTPSAIAAKFPEACQFNQVQYPDSMSDVNWVDLVEKSKLIKTNPTMGNQLNFTGKVAIVTGGGGGLGRVYSLLLARLGAKVLVNDLGRLAQTGEFAADNVVKEINQFGGEAAANHDSVENGDMIAQAALREFGKIDILINNAGVLRDKSFAKMTEAEWNTVISVHLRGTFKMTKAVWPTMVKQKYGRIVNTSSAVGLYGNFGQANYSASKAGIIGLSNSLAIEGKHNNILINTIAPNAGTAMTATILPPNIVELLKPEYVAPLVGYLCHEANQESGGIFEVGSGWFSKLRWQSSAGMGLSIANNAITMEKVQEIWPILCDFKRGSPIYPVNATDSFMRISKNLQNFSSQSHKPSPTVPKMFSGDGQEQYNFGKREIILYNVGVGCTEKDLKFVYEGHEEFSPIPAFGVIPAFSLLMGTSLEPFVDGFDPTKLLHGEHYLEMKKPMPLSGKLTSSLKPIIVTQKGAGSIVIIQTKTCDEQGNVIAVNEATLFIRGARAKPGFKNSPHDRIPAAADNSPLPDTPPQAVIKEAIPNNQAVLYRLSGDYNPLHVDPSFATLGGFKLPILHGLCTYGYAVRHVMKEFCNNNVNLFKCVKARFTKHVFPGETIQTEMWKVSETRIMFQVRVLERNELVISNAFVDLHQPTSAATPSSQINKKPFQSAKEESRASKIFQRFETAYKRLPDPIKADQIKKVSGVFEFAINCGEDNIETFHIDLKNGNGSIGRGKSQKAADITIIVSDGDFEDLAKGKLKGQTAFMKGLIKVKGNMMLAMKLDGLLKTLMAAPNNKL